MDTKYNQKRKKEKVEIKVKRSEKTIVKLLNVLK